MKTFTAAALTGLGLALAGCSVGQQTSAGLTQGYGNIPVSIQGDLPAVQEREVAQAAAAAECVVGRHAAITDYIAANRTASAVGGSSAGSGSGGTTDPRLVESPTRLGSRARLEPMTKEEALRAVTAIANAIVEEVKEVEPDGAPASSIYLALMEHGCSFAQFQQIMDALVETGKLRQECYLYYAVP